jgi:hypothetical protein
MRISGVAGFREIRRNGGCPFVAVRPIAASTSWVVPHHSRVRVANDVEGHPEDGTPI